MMSLGHRHDRLATDGDLGAALASHAIRESAEIIQSLDAAVGRTVRLGFRFSAFDAARIRKLRQALARQGCIELENFLEPDMAEEVVSLQGLAPAIHISDGEVVMNWVLGMHAMGAPYCLFDFITTCRSVDVTSLGSGAGSSPTREPTADTSSHIE